METLLTGLMGKTVDVGCGGTAAFRGEIIDVKENILYLRDEDERVTYIAIDMIASVCERSDSHSRPGFIG